MINELVARKLRGTLTIATLPDSDSSVPGDSVEKTDVDGTEDELKAKTGDDAKGAGTDEVNVVKPVDAEEKQEGATDVSAAQDVQDDKPEDAKTVPKVPCQQDIDVAKHCLSLVTSLEPVPVSQGTSDDEFAAWAKSFDAGSSFFSDDIIQALHEVLPRDDSVALARLRRIEWLKAEKAESAESAE
ncbi:hypothetical protein BC835DRAFT_355468 [Cytidiella melzeri]|nr:hypothetical protein BC835DRAFT_355468 [Cytidiella melzeri]